MIKYNIGMARIEANMVHEVKKEISPRDEHIQKFQEEMKMEVLKEENNYMRWNSKKLQNKGTKEN